MADYTEIDRKLEEWLDAHRDEMLDATAKLINIPSVNSEPSEGAPFGAETRAALENVLAIAERYGLKTKMLDGYAAHAEFGTGQDLIGVLSHVDVVPAGSDWIHDPFGGEIEDGKIFGRGAIDDKGPTIAALYALIAVKETGAPVVKRFRHIFGADEESGFRCMDYYFGEAKQEMPTMGFTPDGRFPVIYAEKGIAKPTLAAPMPAPGESARIVGLVAGQRSNMVPDRAEAKLWVAPHALPSVLKALEAHPEVTCAAEGDEVAVYAIGVSAHASTPYEGVNAVKLITGALLDVAELSYARDILKALYGWAADNSGETLGIAGSEEITGALTSNLGVLEADASLVSATFSIRHPVTWTEAELRGRVERGAAAAGFALAAWVNYSAPLHVPLDSPLISTLLSVYRWETRDMTPPQTMGGGTYARVLKHGVAFGPNFPGFPENAHQAEEYWTVTDLFAAARIYAKALARLGAS
jgi:succinyl-diaminopimelate desuccinylase